MTPISVLVLSTSPVNRVRISKLVSGLPELEVVAVAANVSEAFTLAEARAPNVVIVAEDFRGLDEFSALKSLFYVLGARWIFVDAGGGKRRQNLLMVPGPSGRMLAEPVLDLTMPKAALMEPIRQVLSITRSPAKQAPVERGLGSGQASGAVYDKMVVIGSSTGGVDALLTVLSSFPEDCPPTAIVQHTGHGFSDSLIRLLERRCRPQVVAAQDGLTLKQGMICVAAGSPGHLTVTPGAAIRCHLRAGAPISGHVPSVTALFRSAVALAPQVVGVILTGMGQDGAAGLLDLRRAGCVTIGQDEATSVVYGMPRAAWEIGAVQTRLPITRIGPELLRASLAPASQHIHANQMVTR